MILLCNTFITETPPSVNGQLANGNWAQSPKYRENLKSFTNFDIFKYSLASLAVAYPWSKVILKIELDVVYQDRKQELEDFIKKEFKNFKIDLSWKRNEYQQDWIKTYENLNDELIWFYCNHDHIFFDSSPNYLQDLVNTLRKQSLTSLQFSHWPENIRTAKYGGHSNPIDPLTYKKYNDHLSIKCSNFDSIQIITKDLYYEWWCTGDFNSIKLPRPDYFGIGLAEIKQLPTQTLIVPLKEICRHFDGYHHIPEHLGGPISNNQCPAIDIPPGFFDHDIKIRYGYNDYKEGWLNINPKNSDYRAYTDNGTDYKFTLETLPLVWKSRISQVDSNPSLDEEELTQYYLKSVLEMVYTSPQYSVEESVHENILNKHLQSFTNFILNV
tara:strand:- start:1597 stop:2748 length:1152 start_codon:yes stop_codon:yes gene_type:complete